MKKRISRTPGTCLRRTNLSGNWSKVRHGCMQRDRSLIEARGGVVLDTLPRGSWRPMMNVDKPLGHPIVRSTVDDSGDTLRRQHRPPFVC